MEAHFAVRAERNSILSRVAQCRFVDKSCWMRLRPRSAQSREQPEYPTAACEFFRKFVYFVDSTMSAPPRIFISGDGQRSRSCGLHGDFNRYGDASLRYPQGGVFRAASRCATHINRLRQPAYCPQALGAFPKHKKPTDIARYPRNVPSRDNGRGGETFQLNVNHCSPLVAR